MSRDPRFDVLFEPIKIGPLLAKNRFYQVPHCNGAGAQYPHTHAAMREVKAEGGWAVVNTEWCSIHPSSDTPHTGSSRLWTSQDVKNNAKITEAIHKHNALAGCELAHAGLTSHNNFSRIPTMGPSARPMPYKDFPGTAREMNKDDIANIRKWYRLAVKRAIQAGFDVVTIYVSHGITVFTDFLSPYLNKRNDEYGGNIMNRVRLLRETLEEVLEEAKGKCAVAIRYGVGDKDNSTGISLEDSKSVIKSLSELPDFWDINVGSASDMLTSRFKKEGWQEENISFIKKITSKPVVGVSRYTSPDTMASLIKRGIIDFIGAARPAIADPFLPRKIEEGRLDDIRECIGCNICLASNEMGVPIRCTQNPTMSEEWRRGWHPEYIPKKQSNKSVLVVGAGPAGLEAACTAGKRGYDVILAEGKKVLGGHLNKLTTLKGFSEWNRVKDWRISQIQKMTNVEVYKDSYLTDEDVIETNSDYIIIATGSKWHNDGVGFSNHFPIKGYTLPHVYSPEKILDGNLSSSPTIVFDDDAHFMGSAIAEKLAINGHNVKLVTPFPQVAPWKRFTFEQTYTQKNLIKLGVEIFSHRNIKEIKNDHVIASGMYGEMDISLEASSVVLVTMRSPIISLYNKLRTKLSTPNYRGKKLNLAGDCLAPGLLSEAIFSGHLVARELDKTKVSDIPFSIEQINSKYIPTFPIEK